MIPGISTACFYPLHTEKALKTIAELGPASVELFINAQSELSPGYLKGVKKMAEDAEIRILSVHPYTSGMEPLYFFTSYDRRFAEGLEVYKRFFEAAGYLGAEIVVFHGAMRHAAFGHQEYFEKFSRIWETARSQGISLCQENVQRCMSWSPDFFRDMRKALPNAEFVLDTKQARRAGIDALEFVDAMGERIAHVHISDFSQEADCLPPGEGVFNIPKFLLEISRNGFCGGIIVELYRENFDTIVEIKAGYQHLCTMLSTAF